jgi:hypothetical protein
MTAMNRIPRIAMLALFGLAASAAFAGQAPEEEPPVPVTVFFSQDDPQWNGAEKAIDEVAAKYPRLKVSKISIDDPEGYKKLVEAEKKLDIKPTGDVTLVVGPVYLTSRGERREIEKHLGAMVHQLFHPGEKKGRKSVNVGAYAAEIFGKGAAVPPTPDDVKPDTVYSPVTKAGTAVGWVVDVFRDIRCPMCTDTQFVVAVSAPDLKVLDIRPVRELERISLGLEPEETAAFLKQFKGRTAQDPIRKVDVVSSATKTSRSYESAINEILQELKRKKE